MSDSLKQMLAKFLEAGHSLLATRGAVSPNEAAARRFWIAAVLVLGSSGMILAGIARNWLAVLATAGIAACSYTLIAAPDRPGNRSNDRSDDRPSPH